MSKISVGRVRSPKSGGGVRRTPFRKGPTRTARRASDLAGLNTIASLGSGSGRNENLRAFKLACTKFLNNLNNFPRYETRISDDSNKQSNGTKDGILTYNFNELKTSLENLDTRAIRISKEELCTSPKKVAITKDVIGSLTTLEEKLQALNQEGFKNDKYHAYVFSGDPNSSRSGPEKFTEALTRLENLLSQVQQSFLKFANLDHAPFESINETILRSRKAPTSFKPQPKSKIKREKDPQRALEVFTKKLFNSISRIPKQPNEYINAVKNLFRLAKREKSLRNRIGTLLKDADAKLDAQYGNVPVQIAKAVITTKDSLHNLRHNFHLAT